MTIHSTPNGPAAPAARPGFTPTHPASATTLFTVPASAERLERAATALTAHGFTVEILDDASKRAFATHDRGSRDQRAAGIGVGHPLAGRLAH
jgi:hypothetical protein